MKKTLMLLAFLFLNGQQIASLGVDENDTKVKNPQATSEDNLKFLDPEDGEEIKEVKINKLETELDEEDLDLANLLDDLSEENKNLSFQDKFKQKLKFYWENKDILKDVAKESIIEHKKKYLAIGAAFISALITIYIKKTSIKNHIGKYKKRYLISTLALILGSIAGIYMLKNSDTEILS
jgi:hypothetical protein